MLCGAEELPMDFQLHRALMPLRFKKINNKKVSDPYFFADAPMVTIFFRSAGSRTKGA